MIQADFELWKDISGFEKCYQVSTWGNVRSLDRIVVHNNGKKQRRKGKILKPFADGQGYLRVELKNIAYSVHRLVAQEFIPNPNNYPEVNHKDENTSNPRRDNLEWCTASYNVNYGTRNNRCSSKTINNINISKQVYQYDFNGKLINVWPSVAECGRNGFSAKNISQCCVGDKKTHKGYVWSYTPVENFNFEMYKIKNVRKVYQYDLSNNLIKVWDSANATNKYGFNSRHVHDCCKGHRKTHKGFIWSYEPLEQA